MSNDQDIIAYLRTLTPEGAAAIRKRALISAAHAMHSLDPFALGAQAFREHGEECLPTEKACMKILMDNYRDKFTG